MSNNKYADINLGEEGVFGSEFNRIFFQTSIINPFAKRIEKFLSKDKGFINDRRNRIVSIFDHLIELPLKYNDKPKFVFSQIVCPHPPFLFYENGEPRFDLGDLPAWCPYLSI